MNQGATARLPSAIRRLVQVVRKTVSRYRLIDEGEKVILGLSGGSDSICLVHMMNYLNQRHGKHWQLVPVHIDPGFAGWKPDRVLSACRRIGLECVVRRIDVPAKLRATGDNSCFFCARERRKALFRTAAELGARKLALGHHLEDVNETFLLNLLMTSSGRTFVPRQELFEGRIAVVRPLYCVEKPRIRAYLRYHRLRAVRNRCPLEKSGMRLRVRRFLERLYRTDRRVRTNVFWGIHNLKPGYLPRIGPD